MDQYFKYKRGIIKILKGANIGKYLFNWERGNYFQSIIPKTETIIKEKKLIRFQHTKL